MTEQTALDKLARAVNRLTEPRTHREPLAPDMAPRNALTGKPIIGSHRTDVPSLLQQLRSIGDGGTRDSGARPAKSSPNAPLEGIDALLTIKAECERELRTAGLQPRGALTANLHQLVGHAATLDHLGQAQAVKNLAALARRWVTLAAVLTTWEIPPFQPDNTCPTCSARGTLRIRIEGYSASEARATCVACWAHWTPDVIGVLAEWIRWENGEEQAS